MPRTNPYADAPRLPLEPREVDIRTLVSGDWIEIEIGPGRGSFMLERVTHEPNVAMIGFEIRRKWSAIVDARLAKAGFAKRARVLSEDAREALARLVPDRSVRRVFLHFPDPWWKKRHEKRIMLAPALVNEVARLLEPNGEFFVQTDVEDRAAQVDAILAADARFAPAGDAGSSRLVENPYVARSPRERRAIADGLPIHRLRYTRRA